METDNIGVEAMGTPSENTETSALREAAQAIIDTYPKQVMRYKWGDLHHINFLVKETVRLAGKKTSEKKARIILLEMLS